jgi:hypothetical protein
MNLKQNHVKYGLLLTGLITVCLMWMYATNNYSKMQEPSAEGLIISFGMPLLVYFLGLRARKKELKNKLTLKQGIKESFKISLMAGLTSPFVFLIFYIFFNPGLIEYARNAYGMVGASDTMVVTVDLLIQLIGSIIFGTILGSIISFFLKSKS